MNGVRRSSVPLHYREQITSSEEPDRIDTFQQQLDNNGNGLYKIWPKEKLVPGEYAVVEYTPGKLVMQIWDFAIKAAK